MVRRLMLGIGDGCAHALGNNFGHFAEPGRFSERISLLDSLGEEP
jgi:hypothetical protein